MSATKSVRHLARGILLALTVMLVPPGEAQSGAAAASAPKGPGSLNGIWVNAEYKYTGGFTARQRAMHTIDGALPPLQPWANALLEKRIAEADQGVIFANTISQCLPGGIPQMMFGASYPIQIIESPEQVTLLFEEQNHFRVIHLDGTHPADPDPGYMGHSIGHWEGDTLVVDTIGLNERTTLDMIGTPHTEALHVIERYRRIGDDRLEIRVRLEDPGAFTRPWDAKITYKPARAGTQIGEYICENNRNSADAEGHTTFQGSN
jgi:hypothetical protein